MTWIIHRAKRDLIYNVDAYKKVKIEIDSIVLVGDKSESLHYENQTDAMRAFGYLMEAIKRGDQLVNI